MLEPVELAAWGGSFLWLVALSVVAWLVSWAFGNRTVLARASYSWLVLAVAAAFTAGYAAWTDVGISELVTARAGWGVVAGLVVGAVTAFGISRMPGDIPRIGLERGRAIAVEGVVYGIGEGLLLSALPAYMTWLMVDSLGWAGFAGGVARWTLPLVASVVVIVVHHLGYWEYRNRTMVPIVVGCGLLTVACLVSGSLLAPVIGHVLMHTGAIVHGTELPPHARPVAALAVR